MCIRQIKFNSQTPVFLLPEYMHGEPENEITVHITHYICMRNVCACMCVCMCMCACACVHVHVHVCKL